jgi:hypothetical protein
MVSPFDLGSIEDPAIWRAIAPRLHVETERPEPCGDPLAIDPRVARDASGSIVREGYFQLDPPAWHLPIAAMADAIRALEQRSLPAAMAFHYDEFWLLFVAMRRLIAAILGADYAMLPAFWAWHVDPAAGGGGWAPHRDKGHVAMFSDNTPKALTIWVPLTDATPLNGCIYVVPADRDPTYNTEAEQDLRFQLSDIRALPARAGAVLGWTQALIHWGARSAPPAAGRPATPRISVACEFQRADVAPFTEPLLDAARVPDFACRQGLIGAMLLRYRHMHALTPDLAGLAEHLCESAPRRATPQPA